MATINSPEKPQKEVGGIHIQVTEFARVIGKPGSMTRGQSRHVTVYDRTVDEAIDEIVYLFSKKKRSR